MIHLRNRTLFSDFNGDGIKDRATLTTVGDEAKLKVTINANPSKGTRKQTSEVVVAGDSVLGADVFMSVNKKNGSLQVTTDSGSIDKEARTATFAHRSGQMVLAGVKSKVTSFDEASGGESVKTYDYNLLTGRGFEDNKYVNFAKQTVPMKDYEAYKQVVVTPVTSE